MSTIYDKVRAIAGDYNKNFRIVNSDVDLVVEEYMFDVTSDTIDEYQPLCAQTLTAGDTIVNWYLVAIEYVYRASIDSGLNPEWKDRLNEKAYSMPNRFMKIDADTLPIANSGVMVTTTKQISNDSNTIGQSWVELHITGTTDLVVGPIQVLDVSKETLNLKGVGVIYYSGSGALSEIGVEIRAQYQYSSTKDGTYSNWADVNPDRGMGTTMFRSKIAAGAPRDYSPAVEVAFPDLPTAMDRVSDGDWVKFRFLYRKPESDHENIAARYGWFWQAVLYRAGSVT